MSEKSWVMKYFLQISILSQCACIITEFGIRGAATLEDIINSITQNYPGSFLVFLLPPDQFTIGSLQRAIDMLIARNLVCQKKDIATYAREQDAELTAQSVTSRPTRGRGGKSARGGRGGKVNRAAALAGEKEWKDLDRPVVKRRGKTLGDCLELPGKKSKDEWKRGNGVTRRPAPTESLSAVDSERKSMLFCVNIERYTCILQQQLILQYVEERVGTLFRVECS